jgi:hypothetical protein
VTSSVPYRHGSSESFFKGLNPKDRNRVWLRDWRKGWVKLTDPEDRIYPGQMFLIHKDVGGYEPQVGWSGNPGSKPPSKPQPSQSGQPEETAAFGDGGLDDEDNAVAAAWQSVHKTAADVCAPVA